MSYCVDHDVVILLAKEEKGGGGAYYSYSAQSTEEKSDSPSFLGSSLKVKRALKLT